MKTPPSADRGLSPVVGKTLELGVGVLFVALLTATLFGGFAPEYRDAVGAELGDRTLVAAAERIEAAVPDGDLVAVERRASLRLPPTVRDDPYRIVAASTANGSSVSLVHPDSRIGGRLRLSLPDSANVSGSVRSGSPSWILVDGDETALRVHLVDGDEIGRGDHDRDRIDASDSPPEGRR
ncbi:DUF7266 family protein [Halobellus captivus]|uniref:DUF7266 family protein n=1 Tax=Halobellus captivus TaxID=2592614 RepID=UPI00193AABDA|nr:hypothetical protein [Halobellus captivus]